jgi:plasmid maintenance system antidote protein VapI
MATATRPRARYDVAKMVHDMALKGWLPTDLARAADVSDMTVSRFLKGDTQTERTAEKLARALGYSPRRYLVAVEAVA